MKFSGDVYILSRVSYVDRLLFTKHIAVMIKSGITLFEAVTILLNQTKSPAFRKVLTAVAGDLDNGKPFAQALRKHPKVFDSFYVSLIEIGEASGTLEENLEYLAQHLSKSYLFRKKVQGAMMYPMIVLTAALVVGIALSLFVLPKLFGLFTQLEVPLPWTTRVLLFFSNMMKNYGIFIVAGLLGFIFFFRYLTTTSFFKPKWHAFLLSVPFVGKIIENIELTSFCRNVGVMLHSGLPIAKVLAIQHEITSNMVFKNYLAHLQRSTDQGETLSKELNSGKYKRFPLIAAKMIDVGERTGKLDETLLYLADFFEEEVDDATKNITTVLEPVLLLCIGLVVGFVAMAIISPIYQLTGSIKR